MHAPAPRLRFRHAARSAAILALLALPLAIAWNVAASAINPALVFHTGTLHGMTNPAKPLAWTWRAFADKALQEAAVQRLADAMPLRPFLIRLNNEVRYDLFGAISTPDVIEGENGELLEAQYLKDYCARDFGTAQRRAAEIFPLLKDIQNYFKSRGRIFIYMISPSKIADMPDKFIPRYACGNTVAERTAYLPRLTQLLRDAGINYVDTATPTHERKQRTGVAMFPRRGIHWNGLGYAPAAQQLAAKINELAGRPLVPPFTWTISKSERAEGMDTDLDQILNLITVRDGEPSWRQSFKIEGRCEDYAGSMAPMAIVGTSFIGQPGGTLIFQACMKELTRYHYLRTYREGIDPKLTRTMLAPEELTPLRDVEVMIVEENENLTGGIGYIKPLRDLLLAGQPDRKPQ